MRTLFAIEDASGQSVASLSLDEDNVLSYYDDKIQFAKSNVDVNVSLAPNIWHSVVLSVDKLGQGYLVVNGQLTEQFTTTSLPVPDNPQSLLLCASLGSGLVMKNFYAGETSLNTLTFANPSLQSHSM